MNKLIRILAILLAAATMIFKAIAQESVVFQRTDITENVAVLKGEGGAVGVVHGEDGELVIDDDFSRNIEGLLDSLDGFGAEPPKFLVNTHWHIDHVGGNATLGHESIIVAHDNVRERLSTDQPRTFFGRTDYAQPAEALPVVTYDHGLTLHLNGQKIDLVHYPHGHTDGDSVVYIQPANVVHMGDMFFVRAFPFIDLESGGDAEGLANNIGEVIDSLSEDAIVIPGHGPATSTVAELRVYHEMLVDTISIVQGYIDQGMSLDEVIEAGLPDRYEEFGQAFIKEFQYLGFLYESLTR